MALVDCRTTELAHLLFCMSMTLLASSVMALQKLLSVCEQELDSVDVVINAKKLSCMRIGARHEKSCYTEWPRA